MPFKKIRVPTNALILILFALILIVLQLMSSATQESSQLSKIYSWLLLVNILGFAVLLGLVGGNAYSLIRQLRKREAGSRLTTRMVFLFGFLSIVPAAIVFYFSMQFLHKSIDSWFNLEIDRAMEDALELSQASLDQQMDWRLKESQRMSRLLKAKSDAVAGFELEGLRKKIRAAEVNLLTRQGRIIASSSIDPSDILPRLPMEHTWLQLRQGKDYIGLDAFRDGELMIQAVVAVPGDISPRYLQVLYSIPVRISDLADSVEFAFVRYKEMTYLRNSLKLSFSLTLSLVLMISLLAAIWVAFISIRNIIAPVKELVKGTQAVATGDYKQQLPVMTQDDLGFLVESFNEMTTRIAAARDGQRMASLEIESQRAYLETILANLTSGVISFDASFKIRTANQATNRILHVQGARFSGRTLADLTSRRPELSEIILSIQKSLEKADDEWQQRIAFLGVNGRQELLCRGTPLFSSEGMRIGAVIVIDDLTDLIQAQKNAAWGEVARRLAHEIKNPLTPIQLSAERLQHKLSDELEPKSAEVLSRLTRTIVQQVEAMKKMVDAFSEYARPSDKQTKNINMAELVKEVLGLYTLQSSAKFETSFNCDSPEVNVNPVSMRQVLHNLIKNALEAAGSTGTVRLRLDCVWKNSVRLVEIAIYDNGPGIRGEQLEKIFDPYVTSKSKGTGLGLAIVKKIIEEHGGVIWVDTSYHDGAGFIIRLPALLDN